MFTLRYLTASYLSHVDVLVQAGELSQATRVWYENQFKHCKGIARKKAADIRTRDLKGIKLSNAFVRAIKRLYSWGVEEDLVPKDPFTKLKVPRCGQRERVLTRAELYRLYTVALPEFRRLLYVQLHTIARPGEIRQLTWGQIEWSRRVIVLVKFKGKDRRRDQAKVRCIPLSRSVLRLLKNMHRKSPDPSCTGRVFLSPRYGDPWTPNGVRCAMRVARKRARLDGGGERVVCYTLRHTGATDAIRSDVNLKLVAQIMGHTTTKTTERYLHLDTDDVVEAIDRVRPRRAAV